MALTDEVISRTSAQKLINLTNPDLTTATTTDTVRLAAAATDVQAAFEVHVGVAYDNTDSKHVLYAVPAVLHRLRVIAGQDTEESWQRFMRSIKDQLAQVEGRDRILPYTNVKYTPTEPVSGSLPKSDSANFKGYLTDSPGDPATQD